MVVVGSSVEDCAIKAAIEIVLVVGTAVVAVIVVIVVNVAMRCVQLQKVSQRV